VCAWCNGWSTASLRLGKGSLPAPPNLPIESANGNLDGAWGEFWEIARQYERKAKYQDREDLRHNIIIRLVEVATARLANGEEFSEVAKYRTASLVVMEHWHSEKRNGKVISLNGEVADWELNPTELIDTIADDSAIDLEAWVDAKTWLQGCPKRLVGIAHKRVSGVALDAKDQEYLRRFRKQNPKRLF
jgi:hypothetical protein